MVSTRGFLADSGQNGGKRVLSSLPQLQFLRHVTVIKRYWCAPRRIKSNYRMTLRIMWKIMKIKKGVIRKLFINNTARTDEYANS